MSGSALVASLRRCVRSALPPSGKRTADGADEQKTGLTALIRDIRVVRGWSPALLRGLWWLGRSRLRPESRARRPCHDGSGVPGRSCVGGASWPLVVKRLTVPGERGRTARRAVPADAGFAAFVRIIGGLWRCRHVPDSAGEDTGGTSCDCPAQPRTTDHGLLLCG